MSSMVGGKDIIFEAAREGFDVRSALDAVLVLWPDGYFQNAEEEDTRPLADFLGDEAMTVPAEFFVYKDKQSADSWGESGCTPENSNSMAHFLLVEDTARPDVLQITLVIGSLTGETVRLVAGVYDALARMPGGGGPLGRSRRVNWEQELTAAGYSLGRDHFYEKVEQLRNALYPEWSVDELACHPYQALQFCEIVRRTVAPVPDHLVMKALLNRRRQGRASEDATFRPPVLFG